MCKGRVIWYKDCRHDVEFRLSTCLGRCTSPSRSRPGEEYAMCYSSPTLYITSHSKCGRCAQAAAAKQLDEHLEEAGIRVSQVSTWAEEALTPEAEEYVRQHDEIRARFPACLGKKSIKPQSDRSLHPFARRSKAGKDTGSSLKREVRPEDVVLMFEENPFAYADGWDTAATDEAWTALNDDPETFHFDFAPDFEDLGASAIPELDSESDSSSDEEVDFDAGDRQTSVYADCCTLSSGTRVTYEGPKDVMQSARVWDRGGDGLTDVDVDCA